MDQGAREDLIALRGLMIRRQAEANYSCWLDGDRRSAVHVAKPVCHRYFHGKYRQNDRHRGEKRRNEWAAFQKSHEGETLSLAMSSLSI